MKIGRFFGDGEEITGVINDEKGVIEEVEDFFAQTPTGRMFIYGGYKFLPPVVPSKIVCVGLNYADHAKELGMKLPEEPLIFLKPPSAMVGNMDNIVYPSSSNQIDYEGELGVVIGKKCSNVSKKRAPEFILGYTAFNDVTARDLQKKDGQWTRAKGFDTFAPIGPWFVTKDELGDASSLAVRTLVNGMKRQESNTSNFIFDIPELIEFISGVMTLMPGDVIATGTPPGVGPLKLGDVVSVEIEGIGKLTNPVVGKHG